MSFLRSTMLRYHPRRRCRCHRCGTIRYACIGSGLGLLVYPFITLWPANDDFAGFSGFHGVVVFVDNFYIDGKQRLPDRARFRRPIE